MKSRDMLQAYMPGFLITRADASITAENSFRMTSSVSHAVVRSVCWWHLGTLSQGPFPVCLLQVRCE